MKIIEAWGITNRGRKPGTNEDRILLGDDILGAGHAQSTSTPPFILAVADGISSDPGGEIASQAALEAVRRTAPRSPSAVLSVMQAANQRIYTASREAERKRVAAMPPDAIAPGQPIPRKYRSLHNMCTTIAAVWVLEKRLVWCTRGDTPVYLATKTQAVQISTPHYDAFNRLTSYLGADAQVTMQGTGTAVLDIGRSEVRAAAIMSDGVSNFVPEDILLSGLMDESRSIEEIGKDFMHRAVENGSRDNLSFVMARMADWN